MHARPRSEFHKLRRSSRQHHWRERSDFRLSFAADLPEQTYAPWHRRQATAHSSVPLSEYQGSPPASGRAADTREYSPGPDNVSAEVAIGTTSGGQVESPAVNAQAARASARIPPLPPPAASITLTPTPRLSFPPGRAGAGMRSALPPSGLNSPAPGWPATRAPAQKSSR